MATARDIMSGGVECARTTDTLVEAARKMRDLGVGALPICGEDDKLAGMVTDRDIVIRAIAVDRDPAQTTVGEVATQNPIVVSPDQPAAEAVQLMRDHALRRLPVCENGHLVGVLSLGNLATERDPESALADISAAPPDH